MIEDIIKIAKQAGVKILEYYNEEIEVTHKKDESPLTKADLAAHHEIINGIRSIDPNTPIISEESGVPDFDERKNWNKFWIVDPLDGTKEFIKKNGEFTVNIALIENGEPILGVVYTPAMDLTYYAEKGLGSFKQVGNDIPVRIFSERADKSSPLSMIESRSHGSQELEDFLQKEDLNIKERIKSGSSLKICLVAEGKADFYPRMAPTMEWDVAAGDCVYRNSAKEGQHPSELMYNKENLLNPSFILGF
ncbi:MAG: 3'(2'),5'-bisphosphate nucleotidase [Balneola sp.]|nr:MAG: 3'(2'),5'-bisphosphate nucleotidase [Balneola sp.]